MARNEALANPAIIAWARRMSGLTVEEVAHKANVQEQRILDWESGVRRPTVSQLRKLSEVYKRSFGVFYLPAPPPDDPTSNDFRRSVSDESVALTPQIRIVIREARARRIAALELLSELSEPVTEFEYSARLEDDPELVGNAIRRILRVREFSGTVEPRLFFNAWRSAAENAGLLVFQASDVDVQEMRGASISERPLPVIILNIKDSYSARSFSLLHELAHIALNRGGICLLEESGPPTDIKRVEVFCNHVAAAALIPAESLLDRPETPHRRAESVSETALATLARFYGASEEAILRRLVSLDRTTPGFYRQKRAEYLQRYEQLRRQVTRTPGFAPPSTMAVARAGKTFTRLVLDAFDEERITASDVSDLLRLKIKHLDKVRQAVQLDASAGEVE